MKDCGAQQIQGDKAQPAECSSEVEAGKQLTKGELVQLIPKVEPDGERNPREPGE